MTLDSIGYGLRQVLVNENDEMLALFTNPVPPTGGKDMYLLPLNGNIGTVQGHKLSFDLSVGGSFTSVFVEDRVFFPHQYSTSPISFDLFTSVDISNGDHWSLLIRSGVPASLFPLTDDGLGNILLATGRPTIYSPYATKNVL